MFCHAHWLPIYLNQINHKPRLGSKNPLGCRLVRALFARTCLSAELPAICLGALDIVEVLFVGEYVAFVKIIDSLTETIGTETTINKGRFNLYKDFKEPKKIVRYININDDGSISELFTTRYYANSVKSTLTVACKRVEIEYTEGEFDN